MTIDTGSHGKQIESLQRSINKRLRSRSAADHQVHVDGSFGKATRAAMVTAAYLLGADKATYDGMRKGTINSAELEFVRNPGRRSQAEINRGKKRVAAHRAADKKAKADAAKANTKRKQIVKLAEQAAANYRQNPGAYHYFAGGRANLIYLTPSPRSYRSDCSQFVAAVYDDAGVSSPAAPLAAQWASTYSIVKSPHARVISRAQRQPGDLGMYGSRTAPHHVELWCGDKFIGHGSPPIDSLTPGEPDYYITFDFLN
jgi:cell wall-associated NlpC family hydrolase